MHIKRFMAVILAVLLLFTGCAAEKTVEKPPEKITPFYEDELPAIANVYINCDNPDLAGVIDWTALTAVKENYSKGTVRVEWEEGDITEQDMEIKVRGNSSAEVAKKSYTMKFKERTDFMNMGQSKKWALLANPFDKSLLRVGLAFDYAEALGLPFVSKFRYCKLWMNDEYRGIYIVMETIDEGKNRIDIDLDNGDAIFECDLNRTEEDVSYIMAYPDIRMQINEPEETKNREQEKFEDFLYEGLIKFAIKNFVYDDNYNHYFLVVQRFNFNEFRQDDFHGVCYQFAQFAKSVVLELYGKEVKSFVCDVRINRNFNKTHSYNYFIIVDANGNKETYFVDLTSILSHYKKNIPYGCCAKNIGDMSF